MIASGVAGSIEPQVDSDKRVGTIMGALDNLDKLSKIGTKDKETVKRTAKMIRWCRRALDAFYIERDTLTNAHSERDDDGEIKVRPTEDGRGQLPIMKNQVAYQLKINELLRDEAHADEEMPQPFSWKDVSEKFLWKNGIVDSAIVAGLGPFVNMDD